MNLVNKFVRPVLVIRIKVTTNCIYMVINESWRRFVILYEKITLRVIYNVNT